MDEATLRRVVGLFVDRMFDDFIIGFLFDGKDRDRIVQHEFELASKHMLGTGSYTGRPIGPLHRAMRINGGQFRRRLAILRTVLHEEAIAESIIDGWLAHDRKLEAVLTDGTDCVSPGRP